MRSCQGQCRDPIVAIQLDKGDQATLWMGTRRDGTCDRRPGGRAAGGSWQEAVLRDWRGGDCYIAGGGSGFSPWRSRCVSILPKHACSVWAFLQVWRGQVEIEHYEAWSWGFNKAAQFCYFYFKPVTKLMMFNKSTRLIIVSSRH